MDTQQVIVQVRFSVDTKHGEYNDTLSFSLEEYQNLTQTGINALIQKSVDSWIYAFENPPVVEPVPLRKQLQDSLATFEQIYDQTKILINQKLEEEI